MASSSDAAAGSGPMYWEGMYWEGFSPAKINAVDLKTVAAEDDEVLNSVLNECREKVKAEDGVDVEDFFLTIDEEPSGKSPDAKSSESSERLSESDSKSQSSSLKSVDDNNAIVCHLWHANVFKGATESGTADPGALCRDYVFDKTGKFLLQRKLGS